MSPIFATSDGEMWPNQQLSPFLQVPLFANSKQYFGSPPGDGLRSSRRPPLGLLPPALPPLPPLFPADLGAVIASKSLRETMVWENQQVVLLVASPSLALQEKPPSG